MAKDDFGKVSGISSTNRVSRGKDGGIGSSPTVSAPTTSRLNVSSIKAPAGSDNPKQLNKLQREVKQDEARATAFGTDPDKLYRSLGKVVTRTRTSGGKDNRKTTSSEVFHVSKSNQARFDKAKGDFESRGGGNATAEATSRGVSGGSFQSQGDFSGGGAQIGGVKPLGG